MALEAAQNAIRLRWTDGQSASDFEKINPLNTSRFLNHCRGRSARTAAAIHTMRGMEVVDVVGTSCFEDMWPISRAKRNQPAEHFITWKMPTRTFLDKWPRRLERSVIGRRHPA